MLFGGIICYYEGPGGNGRRTADVECVETEPEVGSVDALADLPDVLPSVPVTC